MKKTVLDEENVTLIINKSKFIGFSYFVKNKDEAMNIINQHKELYRDATHNCHGFIIDESVEGFSDDGEPSKTAGFPILKYLKENNYQYTLVIVTRYFGGTLLGTGGLVRAYQDTTKEVLNASDVTTVGKGYLLKFKVSYKDLDNIKNYLAYNNFVIQDLLLEDEATLSIFIFHDELNQILDEISSILKQEEIFYKTIDTIVKR